MNTRRWNLSKYTRIEPQKCSEISIEKNFTNEELVLKFDLRFKIASIFHQGRKIEEFCVSPLTYEHELVLKDTRILFCLRNQSDGYIINKFRIRFDNLEAMSDFCSLIQNYIKLQHYEQWRKNPLYLSLESSLTSTSKSQSSAANDLLLLEQTDLKVEHVDDIQENSQELNESLYNTLNDTTHSSIGIHNCSGNTLDFLNLKTESNKVDVGVQTDAIGETNVAENKPSNQSPINIYIENLIAKDAIQKLIKTLKPANPKTSRSRKSEKDNLKKASGTVKKNKKKRTATIWSNLGYPYFATNRSIPRDRKSSKYFLRDGNEASNNEASSSEIAAN